MIFSDTQISSRSASGRSFMALLLIGTVLAGFPGQAWAQTRPPEDEAPPRVQGPEVRSAAPVAVTVVQETRALKGDVIRSLSVAGAQRIEPETVLSYTKLRIGQTWAQQAADQAITDLFATELFADVQVRNDNGAVTVTVKENPIVNRVIFEGNKRLKDDKLNKELKLAPRQIFTRSKVRAEVARIIELYQRQGRFAATVEPQMMMLDQNRVDIIYEIDEGPKSRIRQINILGNKIFSDGTIRKQMVTHKKSMLKFFSSTDTYDPDRLAYDQSKLRQFYLTKGYADFRVVSAVAELTPDKRDFIVTYVLEEGERYKFGTVEVETEVRDLRPETVKTLLPMKSGEWYNAKLLEDTMEKINQTAGLLGYAFSDVQPLIDRDPIDRKMNITFQIGETPRTYIEAVSINGNTYTHDKVIRREFRVHEGDPFNTVMVRRSKERIQSLGYFQENFDVTQKPGSEPDRIVLEANIEEKQYGSLELSAGYSSEERMIFTGAITQRNFRGMGQEARLSSSWSRYSREVSLGFTEPYFQDRNIAVGGDIFVRQYKSFDYTFGGRDNTYRSLNYGIQTRAGFALTEYWSLALRYGLSREKITLPKRYFFEEESSQGTLTRQCDTVIAGRYLCDSRGTRTNSSVGYSFYYDRLNNRARPTAGFRFAFNQDFAGLGGSIKYIRTGADAAQFWDLGSSFILSLRGEGGYTWPYGKKRNIAGEDKLRITDRYYLGQPEMRGFRIRGIGPRFIRRLIIDGVEQTEKRYRSEDAIGGKAYYMGHLELELPLGPAARNLGIKPSAFVDAGALFNLKKPVVRSYPNGLTRCRNSSGDVVQSEQSSTFQCPTDTIPDVIQPYNEYYLGNTVTPRISVGIGINWISPFGPFRFDFAKVLHKARGERSKLFTFNVGTQF